MSQEKISPSVRRHHLVEILNENLIDSQVDLVKAYRAKGIRVTQTTASRDLEAIGAIRVRDGEGNFRYLPADSQKSSQPVNAGRTSQVGLVLDVLSSGNLAVVKTPPGGAQLFAGQVDEAIKRGALPKAIATIAGDDTVFVVAKSAQGGKDLIPDIWKFSGSSAPKPIKSAKRS